MKNFTSTRAAPSGLNAEHLLSHPSQSYLDRMPPVTFFFVGGGSNFDHLKVAKSDEKKNDKVPHRQHTKVVLSALFSSVSNLPAILAALLGSFFYHSREKC